MTAPHTHPPRSAQLALAALTAASLVACTSTPLPPMPPLVAPAPTPPPAAAPAPAPRAAFIRPADGPTLARFDGRQNKGIDIGGALGAPVRAAADGRVVYIGSELKGYGNMVIIKHNETFITAYAHNQRILVRENDVVRQGQQIAEMGSSGADRVKLRFEIRRQGQPVDPEPYLQGLLH